VLEQLNCTRCCWTDTLFHVFEIEQTTMSQQRRDCLPDSESKLVRVWSIPSDDRRTSHCFQCFDRVLLHSSSASLPLL
jgi:hypothetical protein